ncbi:MAG TPA: hypothetical protein VEX43_14965 [Chthoniobacterales bacterium]|nr:hypothetical protein [Chthoniobacterales bacterium]
MLLSLSINDWHEATGLLVDIVLLIGAIGAAIKFRLFNVLGFRWRSELTCTHYELPDSSIIFTADYVINNTGQRPLKLKNVTLRLTGARKEGVLLMPDESRTYATRVFESGNPALKGLFQIEPGERTIFPFRAQLASLDDAVFVLCEFALEQKRTPGAYRGFYVKSGPARPAPQDASTKSRQDKPDE